MINWKPKGKINWKTRNSLSWKLRKSYKKKKKEKKKKKKKIQWTHVFVYLFIHAIDYLHVKIRLFDFKRFYMDSKDVCARVLSLLLKLYF